MRPPQPQKVAIVSRFDLCPHDVSCEGDASLACPRDGSLPCDAWTDEQVALALFELWIAAMKGRLDDTGEPTRALSGRDPGSVSAP